MQKNKTSLKEKYQRISESIISLYTEVRLNQKHYYLENKVSYILTLFVGAFLFAFFFALFISLCFFNNSTPMHGHLVSTGFQLLAALLFIGVIFILFKGILAFWNLPVFAKSSFTVRLLVMITSLFAMQLILIFNIYTTIGWDVFNVVWEATLATQSAPVESFYMSMFPNNLLLFFVIHHIILFLNQIGFTNYWFSFAIINVILVDIAIFATITIVRKVYPSLKRMYLLFIILSLLIGLSPWIIVLYSDTVLMPIVSLLVLLCLIPRRQLRKL